jgi:hypothetical protein
MSSNEGGPMSGAHGSRGRLAAITVGAIAALVLGLAGQAKGAKYNVAQCGWHLGAEAGWADTTGGVKFRPDSYCVTPAGSDPFDGAHLKSFTKGGAGQTVSGTRFARWRWEAPAGATITRISGTWWHALHDGLEQRIGAGMGNGAFNVFAAAAMTDVTPREFVAGFSPGAVAIEDRLLCAKPESRSCSLEAGSWSALRALTITVDESSIPFAAIGGELTAPGWRRGVQGFQFWGTDPSGSGVRFGETAIDGARVALTEYGCAKASIGGEWRAARMTPCALANNGVASVDTRLFSDGPHALGNCETDFAGNVGCTPARALLIDNNPPAHPREPGLAGGDVWRRVNDFDLGWKNPDQGVASPIGGAEWRLTGTAGFDTGVHFAPGRGLQALNNLSVPRAGIYSASLWLRDEAGNEAPSSAVSVPLRFDDVVPTLAFGPVEGEAFPEWIRADVLDEHSGPAGGDLRFRKVGSDQWSELAARFQPGDSPQRGQLIARLPESLPPATYVFRADAVDAAGNTASTTRRADGTEMALRKPIAREPVREDRKPRANARTKTRIFAQLRWHGRKGSSLTVPYGTGARLSGRLLDADGAPISGARLRVVARPSKGALSRTGTQSVRSGGHGGFRLDLPPGPSRRITVVFAGDERLDRARRAPLLLRVRGGVVLRASPSALKTGASLQLWGKVRGRGAPIPRRGKLIAVQYLEDATGIWRPVLVTRSDHSGRFEARYRFRYVTGVARIRLRAVALSEERWPFAPGASPPVSVRVSG